MLWYQCFGTNETKDFVLGPWGSGARDSLFLEVWPLRQKIVQKGKI